MRPAKTKATANNGSINTDASCPLRHGFGYAVPSKPHVVSFVSTLGSLVRPLAIRWGIVTIIVLSVQLVIGCWPLSHICEKVLKFAPSFAYLNTPAAIVTVVDDVRVIASLPHCSPVVVSEGVAHAMSLISRSSLFVIPATATLRVSPLECMAGGTDDLSAITLTSPENLHSVGVIDALVIECGKSSESFASDVIKPTHDKHYNAGVMRSQPIHETIA